jgi:hypothetical protein
MRFVEINLFGVHVARYRSCRSPLRLVRPPVLFMFAVYTIVLSLIV